MKYEAHITVFSAEHITARDLGRFMDVSERLGGHTLMIQLMGSQPEKFEHPLQVMLARKVELFNDAEAENWVGYLSQAVVAEGFLPKRVKLEAQLDGRGATAKYYEAHWKVTNTPYYGSGVYFSRSLQDRTKFWATARYPGTGSAKTATSRFYDIEQDLKKSEIFKEGDHFERVILDTMPSLDNGWAPTT